MGLASRTVSCKKPACRIPKQPFLELSNLLHPMNTLPVFTTRAAISYCTALVLVCAALTIFDQPVNAAPGALDLSFGAYGKVTTINGLYGSLDGNSVAVQ